MKLGHVEIAKLFMNCKLRLKTWRFSSFFPALAFLSNVSTVLLHQISLHVCFQWILYDHRCIGKCVDALIATVQCVWQYDKMCVCVP